MSNDKDFLVNGPVVVGKDTKVTVGSIAAGTVDLSTGNYFVDSPSGDYTYTFANPGDVQAFQIQATGGSEAVASTFSTTLYTGNNDNAGNTQTITNGIDLATDGGLVWVKDRTASSNHILVDTERGINNALRTNTTSANQLYTGNAQVVNGFNTDGFDIGEGSQVNYLNDEYVSWSFKKQTKFFDIVTYTGDGTNGRAIPHNLGGTVGTLIIKATNGASHWITYHRDLSENFPANADVLFLDLTNSQTGVADVIKGVSDTTFTVGNNSAANGNSNIHANNSGYTYVAYLFAHDTASDGLIQCGSYTGNGTSGNAVTLGWKPQFIIIKSSTGVRNWIMFDSARGMTTGNDPYLLPNTTGVEGTTTDWLDATATGFDLQAEDIVNASGETFIYMAIRAAAAPAITWPTNIEWPGGITPSTPAEGETDVFTFTTDDGGTTYTGIQSIDNAS